jgi:hypothetical protein
MKPRFLGTGDFEAVVTRRTTGFFVFRKRIYKVRVRAGFALQDEDGNLWRPVLGKDGKRAYASDGATIPPPISWFGAFDPLRYQCAAMGIHDPACRDGKLELMTPLDTRVWQVVDVPRAKADDLLRQGVIAEDGWRITSGAYWLGVRAGAAVGIGVRK